MTTTAVVVSALLLDWWLGEARRLHPLVGFGQCAHWLEQHLNRGPSRHARRLRGTLALVVLVGASTALFAGFSLLPVLGLVVDTLALYLTLGHRSLHEHAWEVSTALRDGEQDRARQAAARMVSRDSAALDASSAATESVLENGNDGVFGPLFWYLVAGAAGTVFYRGVNTLDAMWGYRTSRFRYFGWAAARLDDLINYLPARLTALTYASLGHVSHALACWRRQAPLWDSPNAGPVMAAGAGALRITLGGPACYQGQWHRRARLGLGRAPEADDIQRSLALVRGGTRRWVGGLLLVTGLTHA